MLAARSAGRAALRAAAPWARASSGVATFKAQRRDMSIMATTELSNMLRTSAASQPHYDAVKIHCDDSDPVRWTNKQLFRQVDAFARGMQHAQFEPGCKVVIWCKDNAEGLVAQLGCMEAGINVTCLDSAATAADLRKTMEGARALIFSPFLQPNEQCVASVLEVFPEIMEVDEDKVIRSEDFEQLRWVFSTGFYRREGMVKYAKIFSYEPEPLVKEPLGKIEYSGPAASANKLVKFPYFDPTVTFQKPDEDFE